MDAEDSAALSRMVAAEELDQRKCRQIVVRYCVQNSDVIWRDALEEHGLLCMGPIDMPLQIHFSNEEGGIAVTCRNLSGEVLSRLEGLESNLELGSVATTLSEALPPP